MSPQISPTPYPHSHRRLCWLVLVPLFPVVLFSLWFWSPRIGWYLYWVGCGGKDPVEAYGNTFDHPGLSYIAPGQQDYSTAPASLNGPEGFYCSESAAAAAGYQPSVTRVPGVQ